MPEAICCLQTCNVARSEEIVGDTCVPNLTVINTTINQLESKISLITTYCLRLFVVVYKHLYTYCFFIKAMRYILFGLYGHMYCYYNVLP